MKDRSSFPDVFCEKGVLKDFATYPKYLQWSLFLIKLKVFSLQLYQKRDSCFPVNFVKF